MAETATGRAAAPASRTIPADLKTCAVVFGDLDLFTVREGVHFHDALEQASSILDSSIHALSNDAVRLDDSSLFLTLRGAEMAKALLDSALTAIASATRQGRSDDGEAAPSIAAGGNRAKDTEHELYEALADLLDQVQSAGGYSPGGKPFITGRAIKALQRAREVQP